MKCKICYSESNILINGCCNNCLDWDNSPYELKYGCPNCNGKFNELKSLLTKLVCPFCALTMDGLI